MTKTKNGAAKKKPRNKFARKGNGALLDTRQLAAALDESVYTIRNLRRAGKLPCQKWGYRSYRFKLQDCLEALERRTLKAVAEHASRS